MKRHDAFDSPGSRKGLLSRLLRLLPAALLAAAFAPAYADAPAPDEHTARHEVDFMQHTMDHHLQSIRMSELCMQRAATPGLTELCSAMVTAHQAESDQLQSWLQAWYGETHEPHLADAQRDLLAQMEMLSDGEFERSYLKQMIPHHMTGIAESAKCQVQLHHEELLDMCTTSVAAQAEENRTMRTLLCEEYGICSLELRHNPVADEPNGADVEGEGADDDGMDDGMDDGEGDGTDDGTDDGGGMGG